MPPQSPTSQFLRGQNLEQILKVDEAIECYEQAIALDYEASGPYDRLIAIYTSRSDSNSVYRVAELAVANVRTHDAKREFYKDTAARHKA